MILFIRHVLARRLWGILLSIAVFIGSVSAMGEVWEGEDIHFFSHRYLMASSEDAVDFRFILERSLEYVYLKNSIGQEIGGIYTLEADNKFFSTKSFRVLGDDNLPLSAQYILKIKDIVVFSKRDIVAELEIFGDDYEKREKYIDDYLVMGGLLQGVSDNYLQVFTASLKGGKTEVSRLRDEKKALLKEYEDVIKSGRIADIKKLEERIAEVVVSLGVKEVEHIRLSLFQKQIADGGKRLSRNVQAVRENKDALVKNVTVRLESGKYINIIEK